MEISISISDSKISVNKTLIFLEIVCKSSLLSPVNPFSNLFTYLTPYPRNVAHDVFSSCAMYQILIQHNQILNLKNKIE